MMPIRVLIIVSSFAIEGPLGGVARFAVELSRALDKARVTPILAALWDYHTPYDRIWLERINDEGIQAFIAADWMEAQPLRSCTDALQGLRAQMPENVDIIHAHGEFSDLAAIGLRRFVKPCAVVRTVHNEFEWAKRPLLGKFFPNTIYPFTFDAELGVSQQVVANLDQRPLAKLRGEKALCMYNALNFARFAPHAIDAAALRESLDIPTAGPIIGTVGRLAPQKGLHVLLEAAPIVLAQVPDATFLVVGDGVLGVELRQYARRLGIEKRVCFTGSREDVVDLYAIMDLFVSSSLWEGLPTVVLEAMAASVPVVATHVSGNVELVQASRTGVLAEPNDPQALAASIVASLQAPEEAQRMGRNAGEFVRANFAIEEVASRHVDLYHRLMARS